MPSRTGLRRQRMAARGMVARRLRALTITGTDRATIRGLIIMGRAWRFTTGRASILVPGIITGVGITGITVKVQAAGQ